MDHAATTGGKGDIQSLRDCYTTAAKTKPPPTKLANPPPAIPSDQTTRPRTDQLTHRPGTQMVGDAAGHDTPRLGPKADSWILNWRAAAFAEPPQHAFQQVSSVPMVGVSPNKVYLIQRQIDIDRPSIPVPTGCIGSCGYDLAYPVRAAPAVPRLTRTRSSGVTSPPGVADT